MDEETDPREVKRVIEQFLSEMAKKTVAPHLSQSVLQLSHAISL